MLARTAPLPLGRLPRDGRVSVRLADPEAPRRVELLAAYEALLDEEEFERYRRFHFDRDRRLYLVAHALLRDTLSRHADTAPDAWRFARDAEGRPEIAAGRPRPPLRFNLSHTRGLAACAVTRSAAVGIDAECIDRRVDVLPLARRMFSQSESRRLAEVPEAQRAERFFELWTLKEAFVKARGGGLAIPLDSFTLHGSSAVGWRVELSEGGPHDAASWQFACLRATHRHVVSLAVERGAGPDFAVDVQFTVPLEPDGAS